MKNTILGGLVLLNVLLLSAFIGRLSGNDAVLAQARSRPAEYLLVPGNTADDSASGVVYMLDSTNGVLGGMVFDDSRKELNTMTPINLDRVFEVGAGVTTGGRNNNNPNNNAGGPSPRGKAGAGAGTGTGAPRTGN